MKPVHQTIFKKGKGNCLQACVASILELPLEDVPHFICYKDNWFNALVLFMEDFGYEHNGTGSARSIKDYKGIDGYVIATGLSPRGFHHAVVYKNGELVHDPHPDGGGIEFDHYYMFEPIQQEVVAT